MAWSWSISAACYFIDRVIPFYLLESSSIFLSFIDKIIIETRLMDYYYQKLMCNMNFSQDFK